MCRKGGDDPREERRSGGGAFIGQHRDIGPPRGIIDGHVHVLEAEGAPGGRLIARLGGGRAGIQALAAVGENAPQRLAIEVHQLARVLADIANRLPLRPV